MANRVKDYAIKLRYIFKRHTKRNIGFNHIPWRKYFNEFAQAYKAIGQIAKAAKQREYNNDDVRSCQ